MRSNKVHVDDDLKALGKYKEVLGEIFVRRCGKSPYARTRQRKL